MAMRVRFAYETGLKLGYSIERMADGLLYDFDAAAFVDAPTQPITPLPEDIAPFLGRYKTTLSPTPAAQFADGDYVVTVHMVAESNRVVAELGATMHDGDDATVIPEPFPGTLTLSLTPPKPPTPGLTPLS